MSRRRVLPKAASLACFRDDLPSPREKLQILRIGTGVSGFDVVHTVIVQKLHYLQLVFDGKRDSLGLSPIPQ